MRKTCMCVAQSINRIVMSPIVDIKHVTALDLDLTMNETYTQGESHER